MIINKKRFLQITINKKRFDSHRQEGFNKISIKKEILTNDHKRFTQLKIGACN